MEILKNCESEGSNPMIKVFERLSSLFSSLTVVDQNLIATLAC
jgi:hypothetical protein